MYRVHPDAQPQVTLLGAGAILQEVIAAADLLRDEFSIGADVWSVTSFTELRREGLDADRWSRLHPEAEPRVPWVAHSLRSTSGPVVAASDYVRAVPDLIRPWVPDRYVVLGTDGFGRSDTRAALRRFFEVDRNHIAIAAIHALADEGKLPRTAVLSAMQKLGYEATAANPWDV